MQEHEFQTVTLTGQLRHVADKETIEDDVRGLHAVNVLKEFKVSKGGEFVFTAETHMPDSVAQQLKSLVSVDTESVHGA